MTDKTIKARQSRLRASNAKKGLIQIKLWIPASKRTELLAMAKRWRDGE